MKKVFLASILKNEICFLGKTLLILLKQIRIEWFHQVIIDFLTFLWLSGVDFGEKVQQDAKEFLLYFDDAHLGHIGCFYRCPSRSSTILTLRVCSPTRFAFSQKERVKKLTPPYPSPSLRDGEGKRFLPLHDWAYRGEGGGGVGFSNSRCNQEKPPRS